MGCLNLSVPINRVVSDYHNINYLQWVFIYNVITPIKSQCVMSVNHCVVS